jgi:glycosyltransferase involved in cell wall biosynthesis
MAVSGNLSIIIPTKNRAQALSRTLPTLLRQSSLPAEIIIVDQSDEDATREIIKDLQSRSNQQGASAPKFVYLYEPQISCAGAARNVAIEKASGDVLVFLDDHVLLEPNFLEEILKAYAQEPALGGVSGVITNYPKPPLRQRWLTRLFWTGPFHDERQQIYWQCDKLRDSVPFRVRKFGAGLMSVKRQALGDVRFDEFYKGSGEDVDVSWRISERFPLVIAPRARLVHVRTSEGMPRDHWLTSDVQSSYFLYRRHWRHGIKNRLCFAWLHIGYLLIAALASVRRGSLEPWRALRKGLRLGSVT